MNQSHADTVTLGNKFVLKPTKPDSQLKFFLAIVCGLLLVFSMRVYGDMIVATEILPATTTGPNTLTRITFSQPFPAGVTPVVIVMPTSEGDDPATIRITEVDNTGFRAIQVEPPADSGDCPGCTGAHDPMEMHYLAVTPGVVTLPNGVVIEAGREDTALVQHNIAGGPPTGDVRISYSAGFQSTLSQTPVVFTYIQTFNNNNQPGLSNNPPTISGVVAPYITAVTESVNQNRFDTAIELNEVNDNVDNPFNTEETVGWVAFPGGLNSPITDNLGNQIALITLRTPRNIGGFESDSGAVPNQCYENTINSVTGLTSNLLAFGNKQIRSGNNGGWFRRCSLSVDGSNNVTVGLYTDEDQDRDQERQHQGTEIAGLLVFGDVIVTTPVSLVNVVSRRSGGSTQIEWSSASETGNLGYRIVTEREQGLQISPNWIKSLQVDSQIEQRYQTALADEDFDVFWIESIDRQSTIERHGPYVVGQRLGQPPLLKSVDWSETHLAIQGLQSSRMRSQADSARVLVTQTGVQRISYETLVNAGIDWTGIPETMLALTDEGQPVPRYVSAPVWGPGVYIEFLGKAVQTLYSNKNVYTLTLDRSKVLPVITDTVRFNPKAPISTHAHKVSIERERQYSFASPTGDPWFDSSLLAFGGPSVVSKTIEPNTALHGEAQLLINGWGGIDWPGEQHLDHHLQIKLNGQPLGDLRFDGIKPFTHQYAVPLNEGQGPLQIELIATGETGFLFDLINIDAIQLFYTRPTIAIEGQLAIIGSTSAVSKNKLESAVFVSSFEATGEYRVAGFPSKDIAVWREQKEQVFRVETEPRLGTQAYSVTIERYPDQNIWLSEAISINQPEVLSQVPQWPAFNRQADYLFITHPVFEHALQPLITLQQSRGLNPYVVTTEAIYARYSDHQRSADAIDQYIADSYRSNTQLKYLLLVGADSYDYLDHLGLESVSLIPSHYTATDNLIRFAPTDQLFADVDNDQIPDIAVGRLPARNLPELSVMMNKLIQLPERNNEALMLADRSQANQNFAIDSLRLAQSLPQSWQIEQLDLDQSSSPVLKQAVLDGFAEERQMINYMGHSSFDRWSFEEILNLDDINSDEIQGVVTLVAQWGCWNSYYVAPDFETIGGNLLNLPETGAANVIGAATLIGQRSHRILATRFMHELGEADISLGDALLQARRAAALLGSGTQDAYLGITLLGDPATPMSATIQ